MRDEDFERLYSVHAAALLGFFVYRTGDLALAEDLLADSFERVLRSRSRFDPRKASEKTWIYATALNCLRGQHRRRHVETCALDRAEARVATGHGVLWTETFDARDALGRALACLAEEEREAIALCFGADLTVPEIAKVTKQHVTTVEGRVYRALRKLRQAMDESPT
jgi:RNA polymerase sigma-70 factor, ECF subfamily